MAQSNVIISQRLLKMTNMKALVTAFCSSSRISDASAKIKLIWIACVDLPLHYYNTNGINFSEIRKFFRKFRKEE